MHILKYISLIFSLLFTIIIIGKFYIMYLISRYKVKATHDPSISLWVTIAWAIFTATYLFL